MSKSIQWFAGLYEGEGCIGYASRALFMTIGSNDEDVLNEIVDLLKCGKVRKKYLPTNPNHNQQYVWTLTKRNDVLRVAKSILPFMGKRRTMQINNAIKGLKKLPEPRELKIVDICGYVKPTDITKKGASRHLRAGEKPCIDCTSANKNYMRNWFYKANL